MPTNSSTVRWVVALTGVGSLMAALDTLVVATALTTILDDLGASVEQLEWTVNSYNLSFGVPDPCPVPCLRAQSGGGAVAVVSSRRRTAVSILLAVDRLPLRSEAPG